MPQRRDIALTSAAMAVAAAAAALAPRPAVAQTPRKALARRFYEPFVTGEVALYDALLTPGWVEHPALAPDQRPGPEGYKPLVLGVRDMLPDLAFDIGALVEEGDLVAVRSTLSATHARPMLGAAPTGRRFSILTMDMHRFEGDRVAETWHVEDWMDMLRQVGAAPR